jgi:DNA polymerase-4/DNA polymerase V
MPILHVDGDAFFAGCEISRNPSLRGKPVVVGQDRGIAAALSYEAKALGVTRGMPVFQIRRHYPTVIILPSDYELYRSYARRMYEIVRRYTPVVEEYSIDECFADLAGWQLPRHLDYPALVAAVKSDLEGELNTTFSLGLAATKVLAKVASKWRKPSGLVVIDETNRLEILQQLPLGKVWGIGPRTTRSLAALGLKTAAQFINRPEWWVRNHFSRPYHELWRELRGDRVKVVGEGHRESYQSISRTGTFKPPTSSRSFLLAHLSKNIEAACREARAYRLEPRHVLFFFKTQDFRYHSFELKLDRVIAEPSELVKLASQYCERWYRVGARYRSTGVTLSDFRDQRPSQPDLFGQSQRSDRARELYQSIDQLQTTRGTAAVFLASSLAAKQQRPAISGSLKQRLPLPFWGEVY